MDAFAHVEPSQVQKEDLQRVRDAFEAVAHTMDTILPPGRYSSLVQTKLEEAAMFASKAVTHR